jgi:hypothetical protein
MIPIAPWVWMAGCGAPISNAAFYADETFLAALPSSEMLTPPVPLSSAPDGNSTVLSGAVEAAADLDALVEPVLAAAEALRGEPADERSDVLRSWDAVTVAALLPEGVAVFWIRAEIVQPEAGEITWTIEGASDSAGPWATLGSGSLGTAGQQDLAWDLGATAALTGGDATGWMDAHGVVDDSGERAVDVQVRGEQPGSPTETAYALYGAYGFGWTGLFQVTEDGVSWAGYAVAAHTDLGGRALGWTFSSAAPTRFESCWDAAGDAVWSAGDATVVSTGDATMCVLPAFPE